MAERVSYAVRKAGGQKLVSNVVGVSVRTISSYTTGEVEPKAGVCAEIARIADVSLEWLIIGKGNMYGTDAGFDGDLLEKIVLLVESKAKGLPPDKKATLVRLGYERCIQENDKDASKFEKNVMPFISITS